jgi:hypothetical protein
VVGGGGRPNGTHQWVFCEECRYNGVGGEAKHTGCESMMTEIGGYPGGCGGRAQRYSSPIRRWTVRHAGNMLRGKGASRECLLTLDLSGARTVLAHPTVSQVAA